MPINMPTRVNRVPRLGQPTHYSSPTTTSYGLVDINKTPPLEQFPAGAEATTRRPQFRTPGSIHSPNSATGQPAYTTGRGPLLHEQGTPLSNVPIRPSGQPATIDYNGIQLQRGPMAQAAITPPETWSDATHEALSPGYGQRQARNAAADALSQRNMGIGGYGGMGGMSDGAGARQAELINPMLAAHRQQQMRNGYTQWDRDQLRLGGAKQPDIVQSQEAPTLPTTSQFSVPSEGSTRLNSGTTVVQNGEGSRLIGEGVMGALKSQGYSASDLVPGSKNYNTARQILQAATSQAENARIAAQTAASGGLSRAGQYDQRQKDIKALRYAKQRPTSLAFNDAMGRLKQQQAAQAAKQAAITGQGTARSAPVVVNTPQVKATMQTVPNPAFAQDPFGMPGSIPPQSQQSPTTYWGALQHMLYGSNPAHGGSGNYGR